MFLRLLIPPRRSCAFAGALLLAGYGHAVEPPQFTNALGMTFNRVPAGTFSMGSATDAPGHEPDELLHEVVISEPFWLQSTPVTRGQWLELVDGMPSAFPECGDECPVDGLRWTWVQWYIRELSEWDPDHDYRLPTEAEWEYAARAGTTGPYHTGDCLGPDQANVSGTSVLSGCEAFPRSSGPRPVALYNPNPWGFYGMSGNTWEMCADWYGPYGEGRVVDPVGPEEGEYKVLRGGSWHFSAVHARVANRFMARNDIAGFRLVAVPEAE
ncbi:Formylglycine-generating enzyme, required for sulfatase activity, contains SUMF1/FGE domain [Marinobacter segnicrescens]|uniref:Formylglycine-generating enzyme, required for sulfatase activity, contains SUMF1/FGE domain n=1 Tax=Marinobacter segnicrescens TaxID=430453 RepID=A0A1I0F7C3_9GAMM|nr:Formylglycine-generating enzyme, required for sulfatase activity, contains SUMF1/FGE domain [Marinobacter segnicrescens]